MLLVHRALEELQSPMLPVHVMFVSHFLCFPTGTNIIRFSYDPIQLVLILCVSAKLPVAS